MTRLNLYLFAFCCAAFLFSNSASGANSNEYTYDETNEFEMQAYGENEGIDLYSQPFEYSIETINQYVELMNCAIPYIDSEDEGLALSSIKMEGDDINFNFTCDYENACSIYMVECDQIEEVTTAFNEFVCEFFSMFDEDDYGNSLLDKIATLGLNVNYNFYFDDQESLIKTFTVTAKNIQAFSDLKYVTYSI